VSARADDANPDTILRALNSGDYRTAPALKTGLLGCRCR
jgi:hypothetical protein